MKIRNILVILTLSAAGSLRAYGQLSYEEAVLYHPFFTGRNAAGIRADSLALLPCKSDGRYAVSTAGFYGSYTAGDFHDASAASRGWAFGAEASTITHLDRFSMAGSFAVSQTEGREMSGSMFIHPDYYPIDVMEFTPGR